MKISLLSAAFCLFVSTQAFANHGHNPPPVRPSNPCGPGSHQACHNGHIIQCACVADPTPADYHCPAAEHRNACTTIEVQNGCVTQRQDTTGPLGDYWTYVCRPGAQQDDDQ